MNNYHARLKRLREIYGLSQNELAVKIDDVQQNIARYEKGKVKRLSFGFAEKISGFFNIDIEWLLSGVVDYDRCHSINDHIRVNKIDHDELSYKLKIPRPLLEAIVNSEISPSAEFTRRFFEALGMPDQSLGYTAKMARALSGTSTGYSIPAPGTPQSLREENETLRTEIAKLQATIDNEQRHYDILSAKYEKLLQEKGRNQKE